MQGDGRARRNAGPQGPRARKGLRALSEFRHTIRVRYNECDPQGHVFNANYLGYFDLAMTELWRELGGYVEMRETGVDMVVAQAGIHYYAALGFDDEAELIVRKIHLGNTSMTSTLAIERNGETVAEGELRHVFVDLDEGETRPIPDRIREGLERYS